MGSQIKLEVIRRGRPAKSFDMTPGVYTVGSDPDCRIRLPHESVESRHAILTIEETGAWVEDLGSTEGTFVDDLPVHGRLRLAGGQPVRIGPYILAVSGLAPTATPVPVPLAVQPPPQFETVQVNPPEAQSPGMKPEARRRQAIKQEIHRELLERLDIKRLTAAHVEREDLNKRAQEALAVIVREVSARLPSEIKPDDLIREIYNEALRLGPLEGLLDDEDITEIMVNGPNSIYVERRGRLERTDMTFMDDASVLAIIERIVSPIGRRIDESQPYVDARLPDGSRVNAIIHPLSLVGPCLTIRKFAKDPFTDEDLIRFGTFTRDMAEFARVCVLLRKNIVVSGGTGSGKTTLLNVLSGYLPTSDRIITIEDAAELRLHQEHVVRLESRPPNIEGRGAITIRDLVRNALRMRPDRIVVGECRGQEALDMLQAMNTGHDGSLTTVHANSPRDVISRLETMVLMAGMDLPVRAIREQISAAVHLVIHESRFSDGSRKVTRITEIVGQEGDQITMQDIFEFQQTGVDDGGRVIGGFRPTGAVPTFIEELAPRGMTIRRSMFDPGQAEGQTRAHLNPVRA
jgi:pilus assembly protein CpaF